MILEKKTDGETNMKKILAILLASALVLNVAACGAKEEPKPEATTAAATEAPAEEKPAEDAATPATEAPAADAPVADAANTLVGVSMPTQSLQRWNQDGINMKASLEAKGYQVELQYAENVAQDQVAQIENMITKGAKILVIAAVDGESLTPVLKQAGEAGIKVIAYDRLIRNSEYVDYYATFDNFQVGVIQGQYIVDKLDLENQAGPFNMEMFAGSPDDNNAEFFFGGALSILKPFIDSGKLVVKSGQMDRLVCGIQGWKSEGAQARMDDLISAYYTKDRVDAILSSNDSLAYGVAASLEANGYGTADKPYPILTGQDCDVANVKNMIAGKQSMSVFKDTRALADKVVEMVDALVTGGTPEVNDTTTYDNGVKVVPSYLLKPIYCDVTNYKELLIDSGYYKAEELQ